MTPKLTILTCMHGRPKVSELFIKAAQKLPNTEIFAVVTDTDAESLELCRKYSVKHISHRNKPLGAKWNAGIKPDLDTGADYIVICGDDDILTMSWYEAVLPYMEKNVAFGGLDSCYVLLYGSTTAGAIIRYNEKKILGCGAFIRADVLRTASEKREVMWTRGAPYDYSKKKYIPTALANLFRDNMRCKIKGEPIYELWDNAQEKILDLTRDIRLAEIGHAPVVITTDHRETPLHTRLASGRA